MSLFKRLSVIVTLALIAGGLVAIPASAVTTTGTWEQYPTGATEYQAQVQQPINTANTSNWSSKSKGGIPVMFKLFAGTGAAAFESIYSDGNSANDYAYVSYTLTNPIRFDQVTNLATAYNFTMGDCHGGSLRWDVWLKDSSGNFRPITVYYGDPGGVQSCKGTADESGKNLMSQSDGMLPVNRFEMRDASWGSYPQYTTYANALNATNNGSDLVYGFQLSLDSGWGGDQAATISNTTVDDAVYQWQSGTGTMAQTCDLPLANMKVDKLTGTETGPVNEEPVQGSLTDSGTAFRVVDCKYQYVLSIPSLRGTGKYEVQIWIDGVRAPTPSSPGGKVTFDLK